MNTRFEIRLPAERRARLDTLASDLGMTSSALTRAAIDRVLSDGVVLLLPHEHSAIKERR